MYITSSGPESSPKIAFTVTSGTWYKLKTEVSGTNVKIYVNDKLAKEITMSGSEADAKSNNYVGIWCHNKIPIKGDNFQGNRRSYKCITEALRKHCNPLREYIGRIKSGKISLRGLAF